MEEEEMQLGGNIQLVGFHDLDKSELIVVKKMVGQYARKFTDGIPGFSRLAVTFKEVRLSPKIGIGDFETKVHRAIEFLEDGARAAGHGREGVLGDADLEAGLALDGLDGLVAQVVVEVDKQPVGGDAGERLQVDSALLPRDLAQLRGSGGVLFVRGVLVRRAGMRGGGDRQDEGKGGEGRDEARALHADSDRMH